MICALGIVLLFGVLFSNITSLLTWSEGLLSRLYSKITTEKNIKTTLRANEESTDAIVKPVKFKTGWQKSGLNTVIPSSLGYL